MSVKPVKTTFYIVVELFYLKKRINNKPKQYSETCILSNMIEFPNANVDSNNGK